MPSGPGYWLVPSDGTLHTVVTHNDWLLDPANQAKVGLTQKQARVLKSLDPVTEIDEIRMVGVLAGLIRIRDRHRNLTMQFYAPPSGVRAVLRAIADALPKLFHGADHYLLLHNLQDDSHASVWTTEFVEKLDRGEPVLLAREPIPANEELRQRMISLLGSG